MKANIFYLHCYSFSNFGCHKKNMSLNFLSFLKISHSTSGKKEWNNHMGEFGRKIWVLHLPFPPLGYQPISGLRILFHFSVTLVLKGQTGDGKYVTVSNRKLNLITFNFFNRKSWNCKLWNFGQWLLNRVWNFWHG